MTDVQCTGHAGGSGKLGIMRLEIDDDDNDFEDLLPPLGPNVQFIKPYRRSIVLVRDGRLTEFEPHEPHQRALGLESVHMQWILDRNEKECRAMSERDAL